MLTQRQAGPVWARTTCSNCGRKIEDIFSFCTNCKNWVHNTCYSYKNCESNICLCHDCNRNPRGIINTGLITYH